jgi:hypothetical protein
MRIAESSDWRSALPFETPVLVAEVSPGDDSRCFGCGPEAEALPRTELWAVKHRHPKNHSGFVRFYCADHKPAAPVIAAAPAPVSARRAPARREPRAPRETIPRRPAVSDAPPRAMCPDCFVEVSATGECGMCGTKVF